jgi:hypothetical protein
MMTFDEQLAALGKDPSRVMRRLKEIFPHDGVSDMDHDAEIRMRLGTAWNRAASWEFDTLLKARFNQNQWLSTWFQSYIGGLSDPDGKLTHQWVKAQWKSNYERIKTAERAREWAEVVLGLKIKTNRMHFGSLGYDMSKMSQEWLDQPCKY